MQHRCRSKGNCRSLHRSPVNCFSTTLPIKKWNGKHLPSRSILTSSHLQLTVLMAASIAMKLLLLFVALFRFLGLCPPGRFSRMFKRSFRSFGFRQRDLHVFVGCSARFFTPLCLLLLVSARLTYRFIHKTVFNSQVKNGTGNSMPEKTKTALSLPEKETIASDCFSTRICR